MVGMEWLVFIDPTALCVTALILALTLLWGYVMFSGGKKDQPNLSLLYEATTALPKAGSGTTAKRTSKTRPKKYADGSPRGSPKSQPVESESSGAPSKAKKAEGKVTLPAKDQTAKPAREIGSKVKVRNVRGTLSQETDEKVKFDEPEAEGEWQTQLSRQQLRALRQKKRGEGEKGGTSSDSDPTETEVKNPEEPSKEVTNQKKEAVDQSISTIAKGSYSKRGRRGKSGTKKLKSGSSDMESLSSSDRVSPRTDEYNGEDSVFSQPNYNDTEEPDNAVIPTAEDPPSLSVDQRLPFPSSVEASDELTEVERALKEAAQSGSELIETAIKKESEFAEVKSKKRKKSKRKSTQALKEATPDAPSPEPVAGPGSPDPVATVQELEEWVVV